MGRLSLALKILFDGQAAEKVQTLFSDGVAVPAKEADKQPESGESGKAAARKATVRPQSGRSDAISLLASLQREGRLLDFLNEPLAEYSDAQIGAAVRDIHRDCKAVLERQFALQPVVDQAEGQPIDVGNNPDPGKYKLSGRIDGDRATRGTLVHHGWRITKCDLPIWNGSPDSEQIVAPAEVELS